MELDQEKYLTLLAEKYPTIQTVCREIINLSTILNLPKGTEHFMSDLHGEYEAFYHILNNCSGVIREKVDMLFKDLLSDAEREQICTLIYYPREKLELIRKDIINRREWYREILSELIEIAKTLSSKYTRSKVRKAMPEEFSYIIDELLHAQKDEDDNQVVYHRKILETIIELNNAEEFIVALAALIKRLAVNRLHIVGDIFDRGACADQILDLLMKYHSLDIEWGNHDILWMGAAAGSKACIANVIRNNLKYDNTEILENSYGISLRQLTLFSEKLYPDIDPMEAAAKEISILMFKLEGQIIARHPEYEMDDRKLLHRINWKQHTIELEGHIYELTETDFPTVDPADAYRLTAEEEAIIDELCMEFVNSSRLSEHIHFLYKKGSMYKTYNGNLLYHGCIPLDDEGNFEGICIDGRMYKGRAYLDYADKTSRRAYLSGRKQSDLDFMWYLWCGRRSPLCGRNIKSFERTYIADPSVWQEESDPYYKFYETEKTCNMILREFGLYSPMSHIINGHTPVRTGKGELPVRANGKLMVIDGGFCRSYHKTTGLAGYTLIYNSHGIRIKAHQPFENVYAALRENKDIESDTELVETESERVLVKHTDDGKRIIEDIEGLKKLLNAYRDGSIEQGNSLYET